MKKEEVFDLAINIVNKSKYAMVGTISLKKFPNVRILSKIKNEGLNKLYFTTREDSNKVRQMKKNKKGCLYFYDAETYQTVMLEGIFKVTPNTSLPIAEIYKIDAHDPFNYVTIIFETSSVSFYSDYETTKYNIE